jgi:signal peptide peptidase SppA
MTRNYDHIIQAITDEVWALKPEKLDAICELIRLKAAGVDLPPYEAAAAAEPRNGAGIAVIPIFGLITNRANMMTNYSGGTSLTMFRKAFRTALADPDIGAIILEVDSPGGTVVGLEETANEIFAARKGSKRIVAIANAQAASGAYWLASQASELWVTPSGEVGSIGVYAVHDDLSKSLEQKGIKTTYIRAGKYKAEGVAEEPLSEDARAHMQKRVDEYYAMFVKAVAGGREVHVNKVINGFGEGRMVGAQEAVKMGMVDRVGTIDELIRTLTARIRRPVEGNGWAHRTGSLSLADQRRRARYN